MLRCLCLALLMYPWAFAQQMPAIIQVVKQVPAATSQRLTTFGLRHMTRVLGHMPLLICKDAINKYTINVNSSTSRFHVADRNDQASCKIVVPWPWKISCAQAPQDSTQSRSNHRSKSLWKAVHVYCIGSTPIRPVTHIIHVLST